MSVFNAEHDSYKTIEDYIVYCIEIDEDPTDEDSFMSKLNQGYKMYGFPFECRGAMYQALIKFKEVN